MIYDACNNTFISYSDEDMTEERISHKFDVRQCLANWSTEFAIPYNANITALPKGMKHHSCFQNFPSDCRSLLKTNKAIMPSEMEKC